MRRDGWGGLVVVVGAGLLGLALLGGVVTRAGAHQGDGSDPSLIHACVATRKGAVRIVGPTGACNANKEAAAHWGIQGPTGPQGPSGVLESFDDLANLPCTTAAGAAGTVKLAGVLKTPVCTVGVYDGGRFADLGPVVFDTQTNFMWEKKVAGGGCLHCVNDFYSWCAATGNQVGACAANTASWIAQVNAEAFAGYTDWRLPTSAGCCGFPTGAPAELESIVALNQGNCGGGSGACIDPIFGPTAASSYWSSTERGADFAWYVNFAFGSVFGDLKSYGTHVRAVRGGP